MPRDGSGEEEPACASALGPVWRRTYEPNPKHGPEERGRIARQPRDGQEALDFSVAVKASFPVRVGLDQEKGTFVVLRWHGAGEFRGRPNSEKFHGYAVPWKTLSQELRNALIRAGIADRRGRIL
jgi:hypothetical protein